MEDDNCDVHRDISPHHAEEQEEERWDADSSGSPVSSAMPTDLPWDNEPNMQVSSFMWVFGSLTPLSPQFQEELPLHRSVACAA
jgi:hypothetical protein